MSEMNAYEIRLDLLRLAHDICNNKRCSKEQEIVWKAEKSGDFTLPTLPVVTTEDVLTEAEKLRAFVGTATR